MPCPGANSSPCFAVPTLNWIGKDAVVRHHKEVPFRLLEADMKLSHGDPASGNLIVEGDNLHALKALLPRYAGRVKCACIDPPYNTGKEGWIYNDNINSPEILRWLGQAVGKEADDLSRHDKWLCMMYPRLILLKQFLSQDGVIFVHIDDNALPFLIILMDEIFGRKNQLSVFCWRTDGNFDNQAKVKICHEYVVSYCLKIDSFPHPPVIDPAVDSSSKLFRDQIRNTIVKNGPKNPVSTVMLPIGFPANFDEGVLLGAKGTWPTYSRQAVIRGGKLTNETEISSGWSSKALLEEFISNRCKPILDGKGQTTSFELVVSGTVEIVKERRTSSHVVSVLQQKGSTQNTSSFLAQMGIKFDYPKPVELLTYLITMISGKDGLFLDSFAGSGTTAHAVLRQNAADGGNRKFILVEMEPGICKDITAERVRRVAGGYTNAKGEKVEGLGGGFQYCRLSKEPLFDATGAVREDVRFAQLAEFVWFAETGTGFTGKAKSPLLGVHEGVAVYLLYNGILKDRTVDGGNVLTSPVLALLPPHDGPKVIYAAANRLGAPRLQRERIVFKQTPYALDF